MHLSYHFHELNEAQRIGDPAADIESMPRDISHMLLREHERIDQIIHIQSVANLLAIAIDCEWSVFDCANQKVRDPSLSLGAVLMGSVDATHAEYD